MKATSLRRWATALLSIVSLAVASHASADITVGAYLKFKKPPEPPGFEDYLIGVGRGVFYANVVLGMRKQPRLFCVPKDLEIDENMILAIIDKEIRSPSDGVQHNDNAPLEGVMVEAFINRWPCK